MDYLDKAISEVAETLGHLNKQKEVTKSNIERNIIEDRKQVYMVILEALYQKKEGLKAKS